MHKCFKFVHSLIMPVFAMLLIGRCRFRGVAWANCLYPTLTLLHSEWPKLYGVLAVLSAIELDVYGCIVK